MTTLSTTGLIQDCLDRHRAGDPAARGQLILHCQKRVRLLVRKMLRNFPNVKRWEETSDVLQNVLLRLDRTLRQLELSTVRDFLQVAAFHIRRELIDLARHHRRTPGQGMPAADTIVDLDDPTDLTRWAEFHDHLAQLPEEERTLFDLLFYQGITQAEAAKLMGDSDRTVRRRWQEAKYRLAKWVGDDWTI